MALTKVSRGLLSTGIVDNSNATAITIDSSENVTFAGTVKSTRFILPTTASAAFHYLFTDNTETGTGGLFVQAGGGSAGYGGGMALFSHSHASKGGWVTAGISAGSNGKFTVNSAANGTGADVFTVDVSGVITAKSLTLNASAASSFSIINGGTNAIAMKSAAGDELYIGANNTYAIRFLNNGTNNVVLDNGSNLLVGGTTDRGGRICVGGNSTTARILPQTDNVGFIGQGTFRWQEIYAVNGSIQTSDRTEKQDIEALSDAEKRVAVAAKGLMRKFRWKDAVAEKGDDARIHFGIIAQDLQDAFTAESLDAGRYSMFISDTWWEIQTEVAAVEATEIAKAVDAYTRTDTFNTAEEAPEGATERTRLGVRYNELLAFIISAL